MVEPSPGLDLQLLADYRARVCIPHGHTHPITARAIVECSLSYLSLHGSGGALA